MAWRGARLVQHIVVVVIVARVAAWNAQVRVRGTKLKFSC